MGESVGLMRFRCETPFGEDLDELVVIEQWPLTGFVKGFTLLGMRGEIQVTFDPPLAPEPASSGRPT